MDIMHDKTHTECSLPMFTCSLDKMGHRQLQFESYPVKKNSWTLLERFHVFKKMVFIKCLAHYFEGELIDF